MFLNLYFLISNQLAVHNLAFLAPMSPQSVSLTYDEILVSTILILIQYFKVPTA
jgi:hypothetical protein